MQSANGHFNRPETVLLSAIATDAKDATFVAATGQICGVPLISLQIRELKALGLKRFLVETEQMSGALLAAADQLKDQDVDLQIIRSPKELNKAVSKTEQLLVFAPGTRVDSSLLESMLDAEEPLLATLDGKEENAAFERIDLNTRWSGIAIVDANALQDIASLPEGWSLTSALLRGALQAGVKQWPIDKKYIESNALQVIRDMDSIGKLAEKELQKAGNAQAGMIESKLYAPIAKWAIGQLPVEPVWIGMGSIILSVATLLASAVAVPVAAASLGGLAIFSLTVQSCLNYITKASQNTILATISWLLLFLALAGVSYRAGGSNAVFPAIMVSAILLYSVRQARRSGFGRIFLSPAMASLVLLAASVWQQFNSTLQVFALLQMAALLYAQFASQKNISELNRP